MAVVMVMAMAGLGAGLGAGAPVAKADVTRAHEGVRPTAEAEGTIAGAAPAAQVKRNDRADVTFELRPSADGGVTLGARGHGLTITKTVQSNGDFVLDIETARDRVVIAASGSGATVTRGDSVLTLSRSDSSDAPLVAVRKALAGSDAIVRYRALAAALMQNDDRSHEALALIIADAAVGLLTGDVGAPGRVARLLGERARGRVRPVGMAVDCFTVMETRMVDAWYDYGLCFESTAYNSFYQSLCSWRWTIQVESYWFNFLSCTGFSF
jgi:hypothetical protein